MRSFYELIDEIEACVDEVQQLLKAEPELLQRMRGRLTQAAIAKRAKTEQPLVCHAEAGRLDLVHPEVLFRILKVYANL